jgi:hypothetical protein
MDCGFAGSRSSPREVSIEDEARIDAILVFRALRKQRRVLT